MSVFENYGLKQINNVLNNKFQDMLNLHPHELTAQHFFEGGIKEDHQQVLTEACYLTVKRQTETIMIDTPIGLGSERLYAIACLKEIDFLIPHYMRPLHLTKLNENQAGEDIVGWAYGAHEVVRQIVSVKTCLGYLNSVCDDPLQIAAFLPALGKYLEAKEDSKEDLHERLYTFHTPNSRYEKSDHSHFTRARKRLISGRAAKTLPSVSRAIINECRDANTFLLCCAMILESANEERSGKPESCVVQASLASMARRSPNFFGDVVAANELRDVLLPQLQDWTHQ
jgi:hypothetical protein